MRMFVYAIYDTAAGAYMRPFFMSTDGQAMRMFTDIAQDASSEIGKHPEDYSLFRIGQYDDNKGELHKEDRECLATALEVVAAAAERSLKNIGAMKNGKATEDRELQQ